MGTKRKAPVGNELFQQVVAIADLPHDDSFTHELCNLIERSGSHPERVTLEDLRKAALFYLRETLPSETTH